jgi:hypothetical protein
MFVMPVMARRGFNPRTTRCVGPPDGRAQGQSIQYRRVRVLPSVGSTSESNTPQRRSMTAADPTLSSSHVTSTRSIPTALAITRL